MLLKLFVIGIAILIVGLYFCHLSNSAVTWKMSGFWRGFAVIFTLSGLIIVMVVVPFLWFTKELISEDNATISYESVSETFIESEVSNYG